MFSFYVLLLVSPDLKRNLVRKVNLVRNIYSTLRNLTNKEKLSEKGKLVRNINSTLRDLTNKCKS